MNELEQRVARAMAIDAWTEKGYSEAQVAEWWDVGGNGTVLNKNHYRKRAQAALKAHAEWLESQGLVVVPDNDWSFWAKVVELPAKRKKFIYDLIAMEAAE